MTEFYLSVNKFPGRYHSEYSDAPGHLSCFSLANCGNFGDQQKGMSTFCIL